MMVHGLGSLVAIVVLILGGLRLLALRSSGPTMISVAVIANPALGCLMLVYVIGIAAYASESDFPQSNTAGDIISFFMMVGSLACLAFEIASVVWLFRNSKNLPLTNG